MSLFDDAVVRVGGGEMSGAAARAHVTSYLTKPGWSYPGYDGYPGGGTHLLQQADLMAPVLLNVSQRYLKKYYVLSGLVDELNDGLKEIPQDADLARATDAEFDQIAELFGILDRQSTPGVRLTTLSKVLHRMRPNFIPLYDEHIRRCYQVLGNEPLIPLKKGRSWAAFTREWLPALQHDLVDQAETWTDLRELAPDPSITSLRALDIVGWWLGRRSG